MPVSSEAQQSRYVGVINRCFIASYTGPICFLVCGNIFGLVDAVVLIGIREGNSCDSVNNPSMGCSQNHKEFLIQNYFYVSQKKFVKPNDRFWQSVTGAWPPKKNIERKLQY